MNIRGGRHATEYWSITSVIKRSLSGKSTPKYGSRSVIDDEERVWCCQSCGQEQDVLIPQYLIPFDSSLAEIFKICPVCKHKQVLHKIEYIGQLISLIRS